MGVYFLQSPVDKPLGSVKCWVDDNFAGGTILHGTAEVEDVIATSGYPSVSGEFSLTRYRLVMIDRGVSRGSHFVSDI